jgi:hypothetical protein
MVTARVARQSSNSGLSRRLKPARNGPRQLLDVGPDAGLGEPDSRPVDHQALVADCCAQRRERSPQGAAGALVVGVGPQERGQLFTGVRPAVRGEERKDGDGLARVDLQ